MLIDTERGRCSIEVKRSDEETEGLLERYQSFQSRVRNQLPPRTEMAYYGILPEAAAFLDSIIAGNVSKVEMLSWNIRKARERQIPARKFFVSSPEELYVVLVAQTGDVAYASFQVEKRKERAELIKGFRPSSGRDKPPDVRYGVLLLSNGSVDTVLPTVGPVRKVAFLPRWVQSWLLFVLWSMETWREFHLYLREELRDLSGPEDVLFGSHRNESEKE